MNFSLSLQIFYFILWDVKPNHFLVDIPVPLQLDWTVG